MDEILCDFYWMNWIKGIELFMLIVVILWVDMFLGNVRVMNDFSWGNV